MATIGSTTPTAVRASGALDVRQVDIDRLTPEQLQQWTRLFEAQTGPANPFCSPLWVRAWLGRFVAPGDRRVLWLTDDKGGLAAVAPMYRQRVTVSRLTVAERLTLAGNGLATPLELPQPLVAPGAGRAAVRTLVQYTVGQDVAWSELSLARDHGWFSPGWEGNAGPSAAFSRHQDARVCVVKELGATWDETRSGLKRNVKESLRRARNRLDKDGRPWKILQRTGDELTLEVVDRWMQLHTSRSEYRGSWARHGDAFASDSSRALMRGLLPQLGAAGLATIVELHLDGSVEAAQLVLQAPGTIYFHSSGFTPEVWNFSPVTALQGAAMEAAIERGDRWVNFSPGPNESKMRWSDQLFVVDDFAYGGGTRSELARYTAYFVLRDVRQMMHVRREAAREADQTSSR